MSLLWKTAVEGDIEQMPMHEFKNLYSGDFDVPVREVKRHLQLDYDNYLGDSEYMGQPVGHPDHNPEDFAVHSKDAEHGGPTNYINHLKQGIAHNGIKEPLTVRNGNVLVEGHHRAVAAMELGLSHVPVRHIR